MVLPTVSSPLLRSSQSPAEKKIVVKKRTMSYFRVGKGSSPAAPPAAAVEDRWPHPESLSRSDALRLLQHCGDSNRETMSIAGFGTIRIHIPELGATKMVPFSPVMTVAQLRAQLLRVFVFESAPTRYRLLLPICHESKPRGLWLDPTRALGTYGIGLLRDQPVPMLLFLEDDTRKGLDMTTYRPILDSKAFPPTEEAKISAWMEVLSSWDSFVASKKKRLRKMVFAGIPACMRGDVWMRLSDAHELIIKNPTVYEMLVGHSEECKDLPYSRKIRVDLPRSIPNHPFFKFSNEMGQRSLSNVLHAFALYDKELSYCQGLNFLAANLLCFMSEEDAFWTLVQIVRKFSMRGFFVHGVPLLLSSVATFEDLLKKSLPDLAEHLEKESVPAMAFSSPWFHTIFSGTELPRELIGRIWDVFFVEGLPFLFCVAIAILKLQRGLLFPALSRLSTNRRQSHSNNNHRETPQDDLCRYHESDAL